MFAPSIASSLPDSGPQSCLFVWWQRPEKTGHRKKFSLLWPPQRPCSISSSSFTVRTFTFRATTHLELITACCIRERPILMFSFRLCHEIPSPCCSAVASLSEPNSHLQGWETQGSSPGSLVSLRPLQLRYKASHDYFMSCAWWALHAFSSRSLWRQDQEHLQLLQ